MGEGVHLVHLFSTRMLLRKFMTDGVTRWSPIRKQFSITTVIRVSAHALTMVLDLPDEKSKCGCATEAIPSMDEEECITFVWTSTKLNEDLLERCPDNDGPRPD